MQIFDSNSELILDVEVDDTSYRYRAIMGDHDLTLKFALANHVEIPIGAWCEYQGETYTLMRPEALTMKHTHNFEYTVTMESAQALAKMWKFRNTVDGRLKFSYTAKPIEHLQIFVDNMNAREDTLGTGMVWTIGECIENDEVCINYDHAYCYDALGQMADTFETEFEIKGREVSLKKLEYNKDNPLPLSYGRGNGFQPSVGRSNYGDTPPIEILYAQGGTDNIDGSKYPKNVHPALESYSSYLLLPPSAKIGYDGEHFSDEDEWDDTNENNRYYETDDLGYSVRREDKELESNAEDSLDCSEIYPKRVGTISAVVHDETNDFWDIIDEEIPEDLNYEKCLIDGETMTIIFQSGQLAGKEFEVKYIHSDRRFEIIPQEIDGFTMPCEEGGYYPQKEDTYAVFHCMLPDEYITSAEWDMFKKSVQYLYDNEEQKFTFSGKLDGIWSKKDWINIGGKILLGGYIRFSDERFQAEPLLVRITGIKDYINNPHAPEIELSNCVISAGFSTTLRQMESQNILIEDRYKDAVSFTKRRYRDAQETIDMLQKAIDNFSTEFTNSISPITVQTMALLVGDESLQFRYVTGIGSQSEVTHAFNYNSTIKVFSTSGGYIQHLTLGIDTISNSHAANEYKYWYLEPYSSATLDDSDKSYYFYARVSKSSQQDGSYLLSENPIAMEGEDGYYHLLVGILNSEYDDTRSFVTLYGYTEILPGRITTDKIVSSDGKTYIDLAQGEIGGDIVFRDSNSDIVTEIRGGVVTSGTLQVGKADDSGSVAGITAADLNEGSELPSPVRFWAGTTFDKRESAPFRVTQDGSMYATQGNIAGFELSATGMKATDANARIEFASGNNNMVLNYQYIDISNSVDYKDEVWLGAQTFPSSQGNQYVCPLRIKVEREPAYEGDIIGNEGIYIDVTKAVYDNGNPDSGNNALYIAAGKITGFRLQTRRIYEGEGEDVELSLMDSVIIVMNAGVSISLPSDVEDGQMYFIRRYHNGNYIIKTKDGKDTIYRGNYYNGGASSITVSSSDMHILIYDASNGIWWCNRASCD